MLSGKNKEPKTSQDYRVRTAPLLLVTVCLQMPGHYTGHTPERGTDRDPEHRRRSGGQMPEGGQPQLS